MKKSLAKFSVVLALVSGAFFMLPAVLHAQTAATTIAPKPTTGAILAPAEEPTIGTVPDDSARQSASAVTATTFAFPHMLPDQNIPTTASALAWYVLTAGMNPFLAILGLVLIGFLAFRNRAASDIQ